MTHGRERFGGGGRPWFDGPRRELFNRARWFWLGVAVILVVPGIALADPPCIPVTLDTDPSTLPPAWRHALDELVAATARTGRPWSCPGGSVGLDLAPDGMATLRVVDRSGREVARPVASAEALVPTGEALLAAPLGEPQPVPAASAAPLPPPPPPPQAPAHTVAAPVRVAPSEPRLVVEGTVGARVSGPAPTIWGSAALRGQIPLGAWSAGLFVRADVPFAQLEEPEASITAVSAGLAIGHRLFESGRVSMEAALEPSIATIAMEEHHDERTPHAEGAKVVPRVGASIRAKVRLGGWALGVLGIDGEVAPGAAGSGLAKIAAPLPDVPAYTFGLSIGIAAEVR